MALNYQRPLPKDSGSNEALQGYPAPFVALQARTSENATASSVISLTDRTTALEVTAVGATAALKWIPTTSTNPSVFSAAATANYDHIIPSGTMRRFVVPQETRGVASIAGANIMNGLYQRVAYATMGVGSVLSSEF